MPHLVRVVIAVTVAVGTLAVLGLHTWRWRAGRASGTELLGHVGFSAVLVGSAGFALSAS